MRSNLAYEQLNARERLTVVTQAMARDDHAETKRLWESAPRRDYSPPDTTPCAC
jgi:hypothetical protein